MKFLLILFISVGFYFSSNGQVKALYFDGNTLISDSTKANAYGVYGKVGEAWIFKKYNIYNDLLYTGTYKDDLLKIKNGEFVYYSDVDYFNYKYNTGFDIKDKFRFVSQRAKFEDNLAHGTWTWYYPDGKVLTIINYLNGAKNGQYANYDKNGNILEVGNYVMDEKDGVWYYNRGRRKEVYKLGVLQTEEKPNQKKKSTGTIN